MKRFGVHTSMRTMSWVADGAARAIAVAKIANSHGISFGIEPVNRYETHLFNTAAQGVAMSGRPVEESAEQVVGQGLPFLRGKTTLYGLI